VLVLRDCTAFVSVGIVDMLRKASDLAKSMMSSRPRAAIDVTLVAPGLSREVPAAGGLTVMCGKTTAQVRLSDLVIVPAVPP
jgi:hypothetical protein